MTQIPRFWREIPQRYNLTGVKCNNCGEVSFPQRSICPECRHESVDELTAEQLSGDGTVVSYTRVHDAPDGHEIEAPYQVAIVELEEGPRVTAQLVDVEPDDVEVGLDVTSSFRRIGQEGEAGVVHYGYKFTER
jgi:uncharacterized OB-fold protein